jgi:glycosyltransferase involved in cell wall biosynthesis
MAKVSIVIPFYNLGAYLPDTISSIERQTFSDWDLIIVNDGSTEEASVQVLNEYRSKYTVYDKINGGLPETRNFGISRTNSEYIVCIDADDTIEPTYVEEMYNSMHKDCEIGISTSWVRLFENENAVWKTSDFDPLMLLRSNCLHVSSMFRRKCWEEVSGYNESMVGYQDWDFWLSIVERGYHWKTIQKPLFNYRVRSNSMVKSSNKRRSELLGQIIEKHESLYKKYMKEIIIAQDGDIQELIAKEKEFIESKKQISQSQTISLWSKLSRGFNNEHK